MIEETIWRVVGVVIVLAGLCLFFGCGRLPHEPTIDEFLKGKRISCDVKVKVPGSRGSDEVDLSGIVLSNCHEVPAKAAEVKWWDPDKFYPFNTTTENPCGCP